MTFDFTLPGQLARQITYDLMDGLARSYITTVTRIPYVHDLFTLTTHDADAVVRYHIMLPKRPVVDKKTISIAITRIRSNTANTTMTVLNNFTSIPILNYALLSSPDSRSAFIKQLQNALINVGFLYLEHPPVADALIDEVTAYLPRVFALPQERKDALRMANSPHFLGYSRLGVERTKGAADQREQFDIATPFERTWRPGEPEYLRLWGPSQVRFFLG